MHGPPTLTFLGGAGTVTGSRFLVEAEGRRVLVDCGLFQGLKELRLRNWAPFPVDPASIDVVVLSHAHVDHCGYLPALVRNGFQGRVVSTVHTMELADIVLPDSGRLNEEEAAYANRKGYSKHHPALPLFTEDDAHRALERFEPWPDDADEEVVPGIRLQLPSTPHILGASSPRLQLVSSGRSVLFSGDLGRHDHPLLRTGGPRPDADIVVCESTYGDRLHGDDDGVAALADAIRRTARRGGVVIIPAFAVDRTEVVLFHLRRLLAQGAIPELPIYLDSPMASAALRVYRNAAATGSRHLRPHLHRNGPFDVPGMREIRDVEASKRLNELRGPMIIVSASGMVTGGRVLHHISRRLGDDRNTIVLIGFQAAGTRGRSLADGASVVRMLGRDWPVRANVVHLPGFSVHADRDEILDWLTSSRRPPEAIFIVHGEASASSALASTITEKLGWYARPPEHGETVRIDKPRPR